MSDIEQKARRWATIPRIYTPMASGDGRWVFWSWEALHETAEIYAAPADGSAPPERLTHGSDHYYLRGVNSDGSKLVLAQSRHASEHDRLWLLDRSGSNRLSPLTPEQADHYVYGGGFLDDDTITFMADFDYETGKVTEGGWLYTQDLNTGDRQVLERSKSPFSWPPEAGPDGKQILWHRHDLHPAGHQVWVADRATGAAREVLNLGDRAMIRAAWLNPDQVAFVSDGPSGDRVGLLDLATGQVLFLADEPGFNPQEILAARDGTSFACTAYAASRLDAVIFDVRTGTRRPFPNPSGRRYCLPVAALPGGGWVAEAYDADAPHALICIRPDGTGLGLAAPSRTHAFHRPRDWRWTAPDGTPIQGWLYEPKGPSRGLVVWVHGGPTWHSEDWVNPKVQFWVDAGYTVLDPNYRGSTGFGMTFREAVKVDGWGGREQEDIRSGILSLIEAGLAEPGRIAVIGLSYGGYSSWVAITRFADLVTAAVPICGMYRLDIDYHATEMPHGRAYSEEMMGGTPEALGDKYAKASPGNFIDQIRGHLLIVHGEADSNVGPENTRTAIRELTAKGIPHEVLWFADEGHGVTKQSNLVTFMTRTAEFLDKAFR